MLKNNLKAILGTILIVGSMQTVADTNVTSDVKGAATEVSSKAKAAAGEAKEVVKDSAITGAVKAKFVGDNLVSALDIKVETQNGVVSLSGDVKTSAEADKAIELAYSTAGVTDVDTSRLTVQGSTHSIADATITAKVKGLFVREKLFGDKPISVTGIHVGTTDGIVTLTGTVDNLAQAENAERLAKSVKGVKDVKSDLKVKS